MGCTFEAAARKYAMDGINVSFHGVDDSAGHRYNGGAAEIVPDGKGNSEQAVTGEKRQLLSVVENGNRLSVLGRRTGTGRMSTAQRKESGSAGRYALREDKRHDKLGGRKRCQRKCW